MACVAKCGALSASRIILVDVSDCLPLDLCAYGSRETREDLCAFGSCETSEDLFAFGLCETSEDLCAVGSCETSEDL